VPTLANPVHPRRPPLKWAGGKRWLVPKLQALWSEIADDRSPTPRLVEPFVGGMAVALGLQPPSALLNDANQHVVNFYRCLQQGLTNSLPMLNDAEQYLEYRSTFNQMTVANRSLSAFNSVLSSKRVLTQSEIKTLEIAWKDPHPPSTGSGQRPTPSPKAGEGEPEHKTESLTPSPVLGEGWGEGLSMLPLLHCDSSKTQALLFYYLNRTGFNGLCRFNNKGEFNVPFGKYKTITYSADFLEYRELLGRWEFSCGDFQAMALREDDFIYADPPYDRVFTKYSQQDFTWDDQERLAVWLSQHSGRVVVSNQATDRILALYQKLGFRVDTVEAPRRIACNGNRKPALEMLAYRGF
jgi:site-specific DNA-adenine methylase